MTPSRAQVFVIVGGGLAGGTAALTLRSEGFEGRIVLISDEPHPPYSRPPLSKQIVRGTMAPEKAMLRPQRIWESREVELWLGRTVVGLDPGAHQVRLADGMHVRYDKVLLATGGVPRTLPGTEGLAGVRVLRSLSDALWMRNHLAEGRSLAVVGAGFVGAELAASARMAGCDVTVFEAQPRPLSRLLPPALGDIYARLHLRRGVDLRLGAGVAELSSNGDGVRIVARGHDMVAEAVVVAVGLELDLRLAKQAGLEVGNGIIVDELCRTSAPDVYAAGDVANHPNAALGRRIRVEHWQNAQHQAQAAARTMLGRGEPFVEVPWVWSDQYDVNLQITGIPEPEDVVVLRGDSDSLEFSAFLVRDGRLAAAVGVNRADDVRLARSLIGRGVTPTREHLADPGVDLEALYATAAERA